MGTSSAVPDALRSYARGAEDLDRRVLGAADRLRTALDAFRFSRPELGAPPYLEMEVQGVAQSCGDLDHWVGQVGDGFAKADSRHAARRDGDVVIASDKAVQKSMSKSSGEWDLRAQMHGTRDERWNAAVNPMCGASANAFYTGGGFLKGPDGREYPIVVPNVRIKGRTYNGDLALGMNEDPIETLAGLDPGWSTIGSTQGTMHLWKTGWFDRFAAGAAGTAGVVSTSADSRAHHAIAVNALGEPVIMAKPPVPLLSEAPPNYQGVAVRTMPVLVDGHIQYVDPADTTGWNRGIWRSGVSSRSAAAGAAAGAPLLLDQAAAGVAAAITVGDQSLVHYQVVFEENADGRRRAIIRAFHVDRGSNGFLIEPFHMYFDGKQIALDPIRYRRRAQMSAGGFTVIDTRSDDDD
jgi:hypothetical protein